MNDRNKEIELSITRGHHNKLKKILKEALLEKDVAILTVLKSSIEREQLNGLIRNEITKVYFRLKRTNINDCSPLFELWNVEDYTVQESLLEVLGYDKVIPDFVEQKKIIEKYFTFGSGIDYRYYSDPRYGLAAACAGWEINIVQAFLENCLNVPDAPLKYVAENSLVRKYVKFR